MRRVAAAGEYEYGGLMAASWDALRPNASLWPDIAFYRDVILASGQPALDVGCATGRLVLAYLQDGLDVDGVDVSPEMLAVYRAKAAERGLEPTLYQQSMEALDLPRRYGTIVVSSSTFQLLTDPADAAPALGRFRDHLTPGGTLVMSLMLLYTGDDPGPVVRSEWFKHREQVRPEDGATVRRWSRGTYDLPAQVEHSEDRYEVELGGTVIAREERARSPATRWYSQEQSVALLTAAGFEDVRLTSGFTDEPAKPDDKVWCAIARRPPGPG
jgi:SAM-dependent methyltransferase